MTTRTRIKLCGLTRPEDFAAAVAAGADAIGLVFYAKSSRYLKPDAAASLLAGLPPFVTVTGLFVNASVEEVRAICDQVPLSLLQFHGDESWEQCSEIAAAVRLPFMRALRVGAGTQAHELLESDRAGRSASPYFSGLLLDTLVEGYGGGGKVFDWSVIPKELAPRLVLSGGLNVHNVTEAIARVRPYAVDVSSGIEREKGVKDAAVMQAFTQAVRAADAAEGVARSSS